MQKSLDKLKESSLRVNVVAGRNPMWARERQADEVTGMTSDG